MTGSEELFKAVSKAHQFLVFTIPPNLQRAVADGLNGDGTYFDRLNIDMRSKRDRLAERLSKISGFNPIVCEGTYFLFVDVENVGFSDTDVKFCEYLTTEVGITGVPASAFYNESLEKNILDSVLQRKIQY